MRYSGEFSDPDTAFDVCKTLLSKVEAAEFAKFKFPVLFQ